ncbi:hypothetical protein C8F04DRAFT_1234247 [Mycena alexandri]|uniref:Uncharacterized protein n=1 Tax=Mycena alexandri TaxID=1745969 RepID=A0AAD6SX53_9AGAR|nr:hypothetical protein C8F04DRAFT_1234247 [Mycena alexandri]
MMFVMRIAPELVASLAGKQLISALRISMEFNVSKNTRIRRATQFQKSLRTYMSAIGAIDEEDIMDKSKGDALSKGIALAQGLCTIIWLLWRWKPLDVQRPIVVARSDPEFDPLQEGNDTAAPNKLYRVYAEVLLPILIPSFHSMSMEFRNTEAYSYTTFAALFGASITFGGIHWVTWNALFPSVAKMWMWRMRSVFIAGFPVLTPLSELVFRAEIAHTFFLIGLGVYPLC